MQIFGQTCPFGAYMFVFWPKKFYGRLETCRYNHVLKPPRHQISVDFCDGHGIKWVNMGQYLIQNAMYKKNAILVEGRISVGTFLQGKHQGSSFLVRHGTNWSGMANMWPKLRILGHIWLFCFVKIIIFWYPIGNQ